MIRTSRLHVVAAASLLALFTSTAVVVRADQERGAPTVEAAAPTLDDLAFMAGHWRQETERSATEELWTPARGGLMLGLARTVSRPKPRADGEPRPEHASFEFLRVEQRADGVVYVAQPGGAPPVDFRLVEADATHAVFTNPEHDFPKRIEYRLADGVLTASATAEGRGPSWRFARVGDVR
ncbi:MAG: DUF6265 family protein [Planctomycetota bacterium]